MVLLAVVIGFGPAAPGTTSVNSYFAKRDIENAPSNGSYEIAFQNNDTANIASISVEFFDPVDYFRGEISFAGLEADEIYDTCAAQPEI